MAPIHLSAIHLAVLKNDILRVRKLLRRKRSNLDLQDSRGATALMLAALIRSHEMVTFLLEKRCSWDLIDREGHTASDYVQGPVAEHLRSRYMRFMRRPGVKSATQTRDLHEHLKDIPSLMTQYRNRPTGTLAFRRHGTSLSIFKLVEKVKAASPISTNATCACIAAKDTTRPLKCAVSGWRATSTPGGVLDGAAYTQIVREMAEILEFSLPQHAYDTPGIGSSEQNNGRFNASHSEKLLAAFWVSEQLKFAFNSPDLSRLRDLKDANLPSHRRKASIYIDHRPCVLCRLFLASIQEATGIQICVFPQPQIQEVRRGQRRGVCRNCSCAKCKVAKKRSNDIKIGTSKDASQGGTS